MGGELLTSELAAFDSGVKHSHGWAPCHSWAATARPCHEDALWLLKGNIVDDVVDIMDSLVASSNWSWPDNRWPVGRGRLSLRRVEIRGGRTGVMMVMMDGAWTPDWETIRCHHSVAAIEATHWWHLVDNHDLFLVIVAVTAAA